MYNRLQIKYVKACKINRLRLDRIGRLYKYMKKLIMLTDRQSNLELYRIIFMYLIVIHHYVVNSGLIDQMIIHNEFAKNLVYAIAGGWGKLGINCFVLITGYFMCRSNITIKKFVKLLAEVLFYNIVIFSIFCICGYE